MVWGIQMDVMAQTTTADDGAADKNSVEIEDGRLTYRRGDHDPRVVRELGGDIQTREVNQYTTVETQYRGFESTVSSNAERDGAYLLWVRPDGSYRVVDLHSPEAAASPDPHADDARYLYSGDWEHRVVDGVRVKTFHSRSDTYESSSTKRTKIEREAVDRAAENGERLFVVEYESRQGGQAGSRGNESRSWNKLSTTGVTELVPAGE
jgi:hypothetical protein